MNTWYKKAIFSVLITAWSLNTGIAQHQSGSDKFDPLNQVEIIAQDYAFDAPNNISSGWTTFRFSNMGDEPHFLYLMRMPDGKSLENYLIDLSGPINQAWIAVRDDEMERSEAAQRMELPEWFSTELDRSGVGIIEPGMSAEVTVYLDPGTYVLDCYLKTEDGKFHTMEGMTRELTVTEASSGTSPPEADVEITLSSFDMAVEGNLTPGTHTVAVHAEDYGHNVHVARLDADTDVNEVIGWLDWLSVGGLVAHPPATFVGGITRLPKDRTAYFRLDLEPGRYLFVAQYTGAQGVLKEVFVEPSASTSQ